MKMLIVDCDTCAVRGPACGDCAISALLGVPEASAPAQLSLEEKRALEVFAEVGMLPPLRLVQSVSGPDPLETETISQEIGQIRWG